MGKILNTEDFEIHFCNKENTINNIAKLNVSVNLASIGLKEIHVYNDTNHHIGIGVKNTNKGVEIINLSKEEVFTFHKEGIIIIKQHKKRKYHSCCVFYSLIDYLAYSIIRASQKVQLPDCDNAIILSNSLSFSIFTTECDIYDNIFAFFPNNNVGLTINKSLKDRHGKHFEDKSFIYKGYKTLYDYSKDLIEKS